MKLHPYIEVLINSVYKGRRICEGSPDEARAAMAAARSRLGKGPDVEEALDLVLPTRSGTINARLLKPLSEPGGLIVYAHGGGWVLGTIEDFDALGRALAVASGCALLLMEYRLAPENPFPAGLEDVEDALLWVTKKVAMLVGREVPVFTAGDSAGANLLTVALSRLGNERLRLAMQVLIYPVVDCGFSSESYRRYAHIPPLTAADMIWFFEQYTPRELWQHPEVSPLRGAKLNAMPPTLIVSAECDVLADESAAYADKLYRAGIPTLHRKVPGVNHGFIRFHNAFSIANDELKFIGRSIRTCFETYVK